MPDWTILIRDPQPADEAAWRELWAGYNAFYETVLSEAVTARTWQRMLDRASPIFGRIAVANDDVAGFSISVLHEGTWVIAPICYLEDLFVAPKFRGQGLGRMLVADLVQHRANEGLVATLLAHPRQQSGAAAL